MGDARKRMEATVEVVEENGLEIRPDMTELTERRQGKEGKEEYGGVHVLGGVANREPRRNWGPSQIRKQTTQNSQMNSVDAFPIYTCVRSKLNDGGLQLTGDVEKGGRKNRSEIP